LIVTPSELFDDVLKRLSDALSASRFRRSRNTFRAQDREAWLVIQVQKSQFSTKESIRFTLNAGICLKTLLRFDARTLGSARRAPVEPDCHVRVRIGELLPDGEDKWWIIDHESEPDGLRRAVISAATDHALPFLQRFGSESRVRDLWLGGKSPGLTELQRLTYLAVLLDKDGPPERLADVFARLDQLRNGRAAIVRDQIALARN
jgi:hypothetical protein